MALNVFWERLRILLVVMLKVGATTYGGGFSILAQFQAEFVERRNWLTEEELMDYVSIGRSLPGIVVFNYATLVGYHICGFWGAYLAPACIALPAVFTLSVVVIFYERIHGSSLTESVLMGIRAAVVPIIIIASLKLKKGALADFMGYVLVAASFLLYLLAGAGMGTCILLGAAAGLFRYYLQKREKHDCVD